MALAIATNNAALQAAASASSVNRDMETSMARLSSGLRINSANDDAAALYAANETVSERVNAKSVFSEYKCESSVKAMFNTDGCSAISHPGQISEAMGLASVKLPPSSYPVCNLRPKI